MRKVSIAVLVSGGGTNLQALIDAQNSGKLKSGEISVVISSKPDVFALERAKNAGIPSFVANKQDFGNDSEAFGREIKKHLDEYKAEIIVLAGFLSKLPDEICEQYKDRILNIHPALIPSFCGKGYYGLHVHEAALQYGVKVSGATVHLVDNEYDHGRIIMQKAVDVLEGDTPEILQKRIMEQAEHIILPASVEMLCAELAKK